MDKIIIYSADWCSSCVTAKRFLESKNMPYEEINIDAQGDVWNHDNGYTGSDSRLKENICDAGSKLEDILKLKVRNYNWRTHDEETNDKIHSNFSAGKKRIGFIAQEFEEVFPSLVKEGHFKKNDDGYQRKAIKQMALIPILVKAIQELSAKVDALENNN